MHGKINYYSSKAGVGSIIDNLKKAYDFKISSWHDTSTIPSVGMFVTYLLDDRGRVSDVKSSKFQSFKDSPFLVEADFWNTNDDAQLEDLEDRRREDKVNTAVKSMELHKVTSITLTKTAEECMQYVFAKHYEVLEENSKILETELAFEFDYIVLKRFLEKTMLQLTTLDKRISADEFAEIRQKIIEVEYLQGLLVKVADPDNIELTKEYFLKYQIEYTATKRSGANLSDHINMLANRAKTLEVELESIKNKIQTTSNNDERTKLEAMMVKKMQEKGGIDGDLEAKRPVLERIKQILHVFEKYHAIEFPKFYKESKEKLRLTLHKLLNRLADELDTRLYKRASASDVIITNFYSQSIDGTFSTMTFVKYYIMRLNKDLMKEADKALYTALMAYQKTMTIKFAVIADNPNVGQSVKVLLLSQSKHIKAMLFNRAIEFFSVCDSEKFSAVFIDTKLRGAYAHEVVAKGRASIKNANAHYVVFES